jgi:hypothetical protein
MGCAIGYTGAGAMIGKLVRHQPQVATNFAIRTLGTSAH